MNKYIKSLISLTLCFALIFSFTYIVTADDIIISNEVSDSISGGPQDK